LNPLYAADAAAYSDAFLLLAVAALISLVASSGLRGKTKGGEDLSDGEPRPSGER
jgi:hypothetical protein